MGEGIGCGGKRCDRNEREGLEFAGLIPNFRARAILNSIETRSVAAPQKLVRDLTSNLSHGGRKDSKPIEIIRCDIPNLQ